MSSRLKRMVEVLVGVALAAMVAVMPGVAEAQDAASTKDDPSAPSTAQKPTSIVVRSGDSLWSISREWLGTNATRRRITHGVELIYALNRNRIGADPNLIFAGQKLLVPPAMSERSTGRSIRATPARKTTEAAKADSRARAAKSTTDEAVRTGIGRAASKGGEAPEPVTEPVAEPVALPDAAAARVPAVGSLASKDSPPSQVTSFLRTVRSAVASVASVVAGSFAETRTDGRRLLGLEIIVLTLLVAALMVWKLPMNRPTRWDAEVWDIPTGYSGSAAYRIAPFAYQPGSLGERAKEYVRWEVPRSLGHERRAVLTASGDASNTPAARGVRNVVATVGRLRTLNAKAGPRNGLALGVHNPEVRRASLRARVQLRARKSRLRRGASILRRNCRREPEVGRLGLEASS